MAATPVFTSLETHSGAAPIFVVMGEWEVNQAAPVWDAIYKTLYESLTRFRKLLGNGPK